MEIARLAVLEALEPRRRLARGKLGARHYLVVLGSEETVELGIGDPDCGNGVVGDAPVLGKLHAVLNEGGELAEGVLNGLGLEGGLTAEYQKHHRRRDEHVNNQSLVFLQKLSFPSVRAPPGQTSQSILLPAYSTIKRAREQTVFCKM